MPLGDDDLQMYTTDVLRIGVPSYLRQQKGMLLFKAPATGVDGRSLKLVSATPNRVPDYRRVVVETWKSLPKVVTWQDVTQTVDRCGPVDWVPNGFEGFIVRTSETVAVDVPYDYSVIFGDDEHPIEVKILGHGPRLKFEDVCRKIVLSIRRK